MNGDWSQTPQVKFKNGTSTSRHHWEQAARKNIIYAPSAKTTLTLSTDSSRDQKVWRSGAFDTGWFHKPLVYGVFLLSARVFLILSAVISEEIRVLPRLPIMSHRLTSHVWTAQGEYKYSCQLLANIKFDSVVNLKH